jgi:peptidoglycan/xylan/chitin deacetylase (PgdA/CDA1 family)
LRLLGPSGLAALAKGGVEIGAHSRSHRDLARIGKSEVPDEVEGSGSDLAAAGMARPRFFSYPYGAWSMTARLSVERAGYRAAFTVDPGVARQGVDNYLIPRIEILRADRGWRFLWKVVAA